MAEIQYKKYDELCSVIEKSLYLYSDNSLIKRANYIKIARAINTELGIKINRLIETEIDIENYKSDIPIDMLSILGAVGIIEENNVKKYYPLKPSRVSLPKFCKNSYNRFVSKSDFQIDVDDEQFTFNFEKGSVYIAYVADLVDEEGNLLVLDHPLVNPYYESAIKAEILKDLWYNQDADTFQKYQNEIERVLPIAAKKAKDIVNFSGYRKLKDFFKKIEKEYYDKFIKYV